MDGLINRDLFLKTLLNPVLSQQNWSFDSWQARRSPG